jgi:hypothetical protein
MTETPLDPLLPVVAVGLVAIGVCFTGRMRKRE